MTQVVQHGPLLGRSKEAGHKIVVLAKPQAVTREGSRTEMFFTFITGSKTTDAAVEKIRAYTDKPWDVIRAAVQRGLIELEPRADKTKAAVKQAAAPKATKAMASKTAKVAKPKATKPVAVKPTKAKKPRSAGRRAVDKSHNVEPVL